jgi:uncharacterized protein (TIGR02246 family)
MRHAVEDVVADLDAAFASRDLEGVLDFYESGAAVVISPGGMTACGRDEIRRAFAPIIANGARARQLTTRVIEADGVALFLSHWTLTGDLGGESHLTATTVFRRGPDGTWRILIDNSFGPLVLGPRPD